MTPSARSADTADDLIEWLLDYASRRIDLHLQDERRCLAPHVIVDLGRRGAFGIAIPRELGGRGFSVTDQLRVVEAYGAIDLSIGSFAVVNASLGVRPIVGFARREVQEEILPLIASGRMMSAFALTEPGAGSNPDAIATRAHRSASGGWLLNGEKMWIGNAEWAGVYCVFAVNESDGPDAGITGYVLRSETDGLRVGRQLLTLGIRPTVQNRLHLEDAKVPDRDLLGEPGGGKAIMQATMMPVRLEVAAGAVGAMKRCIVLMHRYSMRRSIGTGRLADNGLTRVIMNDALAKMSAVRSLVYLIARHCDDGAQVPAELYGLAKAAGSELLWSVADRTVQLLGGRGYTENNHAARILRDSRILRIFEGPTETLLHFAGAAARMRGLRRFVADTLGKAHLGEEFVADLEEISRVAPGSSDAHRHLSLIRVGQLAMWLSLRVAAAVDNDRSPSSLGAMTIDMMARHYQQAKRECLDASFGELLTTDGIDEALKTCDLGRVDPAVIGIEDELDPLLRA